MLIKHKTTGYPRYTQDLSIIDVLIVRYRSRPALLNNVSPLTAHWTSHWVLRRVQHKLQELHDMLNTSSMGVRVNARHFQYHLK